MAGSDEVLTEKKLINNDMKMRMNKVFYYLLPSLAWRGLGVGLLLLMMVACGGSEKDYDATGTFEATETTVFAEQSGALLRFDVNEGDMMEAGRQVGLIDTTQTWLKIQQMDATKAVYESQKPDMERQIAATRQQLAKAQQDEQRYRELVADGAAPAKMLDDATSQVKVLQRQLDAQISSLTTSTQALDKQTAAADVQKAQLQDMLRKCHVITPMKGTVLEKYVERGEFVSVGKPLFKMADTESMKLRAYVTSVQLQHIKVGQQVKVFADYGDGQRKEYAGTVSWISSRSEFTPKTILTDDERADLVYAVKVAIRNDGFVKIGMYGEMKIHP
jgi:HlyD family secretion protein